MLSNLHGSDGAPEAWKETIPAEDQAIVHLAVYSSVTEQVATDAAAVEALQVPPNMKSVSFLRTH